MAQEQTKKPKILMVMFEEVPSPTGPACWITEQIKALVPVFDLDVLSLKSEDLAHIERYHGARLLRVPVGTGSFLARVKSFQRALNRQLDSEEYRLCHFSSIWEGLVLAARKKSAGFKLVYEVHTLPSVDFKVTHPDEKDVVEQSFSLKQQEERCLSLADRVLAGSELLRAHLKTRGVDPERIEVIRPALDLAPFDNADGVQPQSGTILYLGSLAPWQGISSLLMALAELPHGLPVRLQLVSRSHPAWHKRVQGKLQMLGLARKVELSQPVPLEELPAVVGRANVCVAPFANHEHNRMAASTPHKLLVYMACRRPVVAADQPAVREIVEHGVHGLLYHTGDVPGLAEALQRLLLDRDLASRLGNQARLHLEDALGLEASTGKLLAVYRALAGAPPARVNAPTDLDTAPRPAPADDPDTRPIPRQELDMGQDTGAMEHTDDTAPVPHAVGEPVQDRAEGGDTDRDTDPGGRSGEQEEELVFRSVYDEDTDPRATRPHQDNWQVMEVGEVNLPARQEEPGDTGKGKRPQSRWLLGGPPYPVERDAPRIDPSRAPTSRGEADDTSPGVQMVSDSDVMELVDPDDIEPIDSPPTRPRGSKKKR